MAGIVPPNHWICFASVGFPQGVSLHPLLHLADEGCKLWDLCFQWSCQTTHLPSSTKRSSSSRAGAGGNRRSTRCRCSREIWIRRYTRRRESLTSYMFCPSVPDRASLCLESRVYHRFHFHSKHAFSFCYTSTPKSAKIYNVFNAGLCPPSTIYIASSNRRLHGQNPTSSNPIRILEAPRHHAIPLREAQLLPQEDGILWR